MIFFVSDFQIFNARIKIDISLKKSQSTIKLVILLIFWRIFDKVST